MHIVKYIMLMFVGCHVCAAYTQQAPSIEWQLLLGDDTYYGIGSNPDVFPTIDGGYIVGQTLGYQVVVTKLNASGQIIWQNYFESDLFESGNGEVGLSDIKPTPDGGYVFLGHMKSYPFGIQSSWVVKMNEEGILEWENIYTISSSDMVFDDHMTSIIPVTDGYIMAGSIRMDFDNNYGPRILKIDNFGNVLWDNVLYNSGRGHLNSLTQTPDGGSIAAGYWISESGMTYKYRVVKTDSEGNLEWDEIFGNEPQGDIYYCYQVATSISITSDGGYIISGIKQSLGGVSDGEYGNGDLWVVRLDSDGNLLWEKVFGGSGLEGDPSTIVSTPYGGYIIATTTSSNDHDISFNYGNTDDLWLIEIDDVGNMIWEKSYGGYANDGVSPALNYASAPLNSFVQTADGGFILAGISYSSTLAEGSGDLEDVPGDAGAWIVKFSPVLGAKYIPNETLLNTFPNPTDGVLNFDQTISQISVYDILGKLVLYKEENASQMDFSSLPKGVYILYAVDFKGEHVHAKITKK